MTNLSSLDNATLSAQTIAVQVFIFERTLYNTDADRVGRGPRARLLCAGKGVVMLISLWNANFNTLTIIEDHYNIEGAVWPRLRPEPPL